MISFHQNWRLIVTSVACKKSRGGPSALLDCGHDLADAFFADRSNREYSSNVMRVNVEVAVEFFFDEAGKGGRRTSGTFLLEEFFGRGGGGWCWLLGRHEGEMRGFFSGELDGRGGG